MNIFVLSDNFEECAEWHLDKHIVKMPLESAQLLCTALHYNGDMNTLYKPTYRKHPCAIWAAKNRNNFLWLCNLGKAICAEYTYRYGKIHKCERVIEQCEKSYAILPDEPMTPFAQAMPIVYKNPDAITAYRTYYRSDKRHIAKWSKRQVPDWFN